MPILPLPHTDAPHVEAQLQNSTLGALGARLPESGLTFTMRAPTMGVQTRIGALRSRKDLKGRVGRLTAYALALALEELGGQTCGTDGRALDEAALRIAQLSIGDVLYLSLYRKMLAEPDGISLEGGACPKCAAEFGTVTVPLEDVAVAVAAPGSDPPRARVGLRHGIPLPNGARIRTVLLRPPVWADTFWLLTAEAAENPQLLRILVLKSAICGNDLNDAPTLLREILEEMTPADAARLEAVLEEITPTPDMRVEVACPKCGAEAASAINWSDGSFL